MNAQDLRNELIFTMVRNRIVGSHKRQVTTVVGWAVPTDERGRAETLLREMATDPGAPVESYGGGHRANVRLTSSQAAIEYLKANDGDVPFGYD